MPIEERFQSGQLLSALSTFGIGGPIRYYFAVREIADLREALQWALTHSVPYFILGRGSNCLFDDRGFDGLVIHQKIDFCQIQGDAVTVGAGVSFSFLGIQTAKRELNGLEFASGIPGSVGGAIYMNAGANGQEVSQTLEEVSYLEETGREKVFKKEELSFGYRTSPFQSMRGAILAARFQLSLQKESRKRQLAIIDYRMKTQPTRDKSAGCIFRNPSREVSAGALIERCGLKGFAIGGAQVSNIHANFIVNVSHATAEEVSALIETIQIRVKQETGMCLEPEIKRIFHVPS